MNSAAIRVKTQRAAANAQNPTAFHRVIPPAGASIAVTTNGLPVGSLGQLFRSTGTTVMFR